MTTQRRHSRQHAPRPAPFGMRVAPADIAVKMAAHQQHLLDTRVCDGEWVMQVLASPALGLIDGGPLFVRVFDHEWHPTPDRPFYPTGFAAFTTDVNDAYRWPSASAVLAASVAQCVCVPLRPDGQPNRPLATYTIAVVRASEAIL